MENPKIDPARLPELYEAISQLSASQNEADIIQRVLDSALKLVNAQHAFLQLANSPSIHIAPTPTQGLMEFFSGISETLAVNMVQARASIYVSNWQEFSAFANEHFLGFLASHTAAIVALKTPRAEVGTLAVTRDISAGAFTSDETLALEFFAKWAALALDAAQVSKIRESCVGFIHGACFDIRTPMSFIVGFSQLLLSDLASVASNEQIEMLSLLNKRAMKVSALTNVLPDLAQIEFDTLRLRLTSVDIARDITKTIDELRPQLDAKGHILKIIAPSSIPPVIADEWRFHQIMAGLVSNADKFMLQEGQITVTVVVADKVVHISVADTGLGIQPNEQPQVFSKWFHANLPVDLRHLQGVGTSLYIFKHAVEGMGGTIGFESESGKGSTFWLTLPIAEPEASPNS
jgi:signal transduction histidine kinase